MLFCSVDNRLNIQQTSMDSIPPCLTPLVTWDGSDKCFPHFICIVCSLHQCFSSRTKHIGTFLWINISNDFICRPNTRSNAFEASKKTACTDEPWVTKYEAVCFKKCRGSTDSPKFNNPNQRTQIWLTFWSLQTFVGQSHAPF